MTYFHPERMPVLPARRRKAARLQLEEAVARSARQPRRRPSVVIAAAIAIVALSTCAAAIAVASHRPVTNRHQARCFTVADVSGFNTSVAVPGKPGTVGQVHNAHGACAGLFRLGVLKLGAKRVIARPAKVTHAVPALTVCVWHDGTAAVFPGRRGICARLDLSAAARR
jgi:hypothetical protein